MTLARHIDNLNEKCLRRLSVIKRLASTSWGANKATLRNLYIGYIRSTMESTLAIQSFSPRCHKLDTLQNAAVRYICGGMRSTPISACEIDADIEPLKIRREKASALMHERVLRKEAHHPCRKLVDGWHPCKRIKKKSPLSVAVPLVEEYCLPTQRALSDPLGPAPFSRLDLPVINTCLSDASVTRESNPHMLKAATLETISLYHQGMVHAYTDGSATDEGRTGFGAIIQYPDGTKNTISRAYDFNSTNFHAEVMAIRSTLEVIKQAFDDSTTPSDIVIFSDSQATLQALKNPLSCNPSLFSILEIIDLMRGKYKIATYLQWVPGHADIKGNELADRLAKQGTEQTQTLTPCDLRAVTKTLCSKAKVKWINEWDSDERGRSMYSFLPKPNRNDPINSLPRKAQSAIFQMRTGHCRLNSHLSRIKRNHSPMCRHCKLAIETVDHFLFECPALTGERARYLPSNPCRENCLYGPVTDLHNTHTYIHRNIQKAI